MQRASYTLFEILFVLMLIVCCIGGGTFGIKRALNHETFEKHVQEVIDQIAIAEELMIDTKSDVMLTLQAGEAALITPSGVKRRTLPQIRAAYFNGGAAELHFDGILGCSPRGQLLLKGKRHTRTIQLSGIPGTINQEGVEVHEASYPQEILSLT